MTRLRTLAWAAVIAAAVGAPEARALTFLQAMTGDEAAPVDARSAAMGRSHGATGFVGVTASINPALLARARVLEITASGNVHRMQETRSIPAYDSFDAYLVESIYALNHMSSSDISFGVAGSPDGDDFGSRVGLGVTHAPIWDFRYDYTEQIRDPNAFTQPRDDLLGLNDIQSDGRIAATSLGAALQVFHWLDLGVALDVARGRQQLLTREWFVQIDSTSVGTAEISELSGTRWTLGAAFHPHPSVSFAAHWRSDLELGGDFRFSDPDGRFAWIGDVTANAAADSGIVEIRYPQELGAGVTFRPRAKVLTTFQADFTWRQWSRYAHSLFEDPLLKDAWDARVGVEHVFYNGVPLRFGFRYAPSPQDDEVTTTAFSFGSGLVRGNTRVDLGFEVANRQYRATDVFDDAAFGGASRPVDYDLVEETATGVFLSVSWATDSLGG